MPSPQRTQNHGPQHAKLEGVGPLKRVGSFLVHHDRGADRLCFRSLGLIHHAFKAPVFLKLSHRSQSGLQVAEGLGRVGGRWVAHLVTVVDPVATGARPDLTGLEREPIPLPNHRRWATRSGRRCPNVKASECLP